jgi:hypothetical protein
VIRSAAASLLLLCAASAVGLGLAEAIARVAAPHWAPQHAERNFWGYDPLLGWAHRPGQRGEMHHPDFRIQVAISSQGLRDREYPLERTPGKRRMLVLGDSFAWGFGVEQDEAFSERIEARHPGWEILNAGTSGWGTDQQLLFLRERGLRWRPDVVLLLFHPNDVADNAATSRYGYPKPRFTLGPRGLELGNVPVPRLSWRRRAERFLLQSSYLYNQLQAVWWRLHHGAPEARAAFVPVAASEAGEPAAEAELDFAPTAALLGELARLARENGAAFAVVSAPAPEPVRAALSRALEELSVPYRALDSSFRGRPREEWKFAHDPHWNAAGQRIAADAVEEFLLELGLLP